MYLFTHCVVLGHLKNQPCSFLEHRLIFSFLMAFNLLPLSACRSGKADPQPEGIAISANVIDGPISYSIATLHL